MESKLMWLRILYAVAFAYVIWCESSTVVPFKGVYEPGSDRHPSCVDHM